jgi:hypothetical protein
MAENAAFLYRAMAGWLTRRTGASCEVIEADGDA